MTEIKIEKGIPVPTTYPKYPFKNMEVGDSFFVSGHKTTATLAPSVGSFQKKNPGTKFTTRKVDGGVRCWRVA